MLKPVDKKTFLEMNFLHSMPEVYHLRGATHLPDESYYYLLDSSGLGIKGLVKVRGSGMFTQALSNMDKMCEEIGDNFKLSPEHEELLNILSASPFPLWVKFTQSNILLTLLDGPKFMFQREWNQIAGVEVLKSLLVEKDFTLGNLETLLKNVSDTKFQGVLFYYEPGKGLILPELN